MNKKDKKYNALVGSFFLLLGVFTLNVLVSMAVKHMRIDLTEDRLYSLSDGIKPLVSNLDEQIELDFYFSQEAAIDLPQFKSYSERVKEFLEELVLASNNLKLNIYDPQPYSEAEDSARAAELAVLRVDGVGRELTFGLVVRNQVDEQEVISYLDPAKESFLEYEVARAILSLSSRNKTRMGFLSSIQMDAQYNPSNPQQMVPEWRILSEIKELYDLEIIDTSADELPSDMEVLVIIHPRNFSDNLLKSIDNYAVNGGKILMFLDPWCESAPEVSPSGNPMAQGSSPSVSSLGDLLNSWGVSFDDKKIIGDKNFAQRVQARMSGAVQVIDYIIWLGLNKEAFNLGDPITGSLDRINMATAGSFNILENSKSKIEPLILSSKESMMMDTAPLQFMSDPTILINNFKATGDKKIISARLTGQIDSAYGDDQKISGEANIILVGDADMLQNQNWISEERLGPISLGWRTMADNGSFVLNALEVLSGDDALLSLRGRGGYSRPFDKVKDLRQIAENRYLAREQELQESISVTEKKISDLQREKTNESMLILSPEQEVEINRLQSNVLKARKELREVRFNLQKDIESLGQSLMLSNVIVWPLIVAFGALWFSINRYRKQGRS